jgi:hypothetical protein
MEERESFEAINYSIRPAKAAQRHMLTEAIGRLTRFAPLPNYQYVGFGSTFFVDFRTFHQRFGIERMFSIERAVDKKRRFDFNRPLRCVAMLYGESQEMLNSRTIDWGKDPSIVWLDYDQPLDVPKLGDCGRVLRRAKHGSLLVVSFSEQSGEVEGRAERVRDWLEHWVSDDLEDEMLDPVTYGELGLDALTEHSHEALEHAGGDKVFRQLFRFRYSDGHPMVTWGGLILDADRQEEANDCVFEKLPYVVAEGEATYRIVIPNLTPAERALAERHLPNRPAEAKRVLLRHDVPAEDAELLQALYRYAPRFIETFA